MKKDIDKAVQTDGREKGAPAEAQHSGFGGDMEPATTRTVEMVTLEIRTLHRQAEQVLLGYAIEIGRRLVEVKGMLSHGEWGRYLEAEVEYSQSTANNFMRIFEEYGASQQSLFGPEANSQTLGNLPYSKALALIAVPREERETFAREHGKDAFQTVEEEQRKNGTTDMRGVWEGFSRYYDAGAVGLTFEQSFSEYGRVLTHKQKVYAFTAGQNDAALTLKEGKEAARFATVYGKEAGFIPNKFSRDVSAADAQIINAMGKALGRKITFAESVRGGEGNGATLNGIITIAQGAKNPVLEVVRHEITHEMQRLAPAEYKQYRDYAVQAIVAGNDTSIDLVGQKVAQYAEHGEHGVKLTREEAMDEIAADLSGKLLTHKETIERFVRENPTVAEKFRDALHRVVEKIRGVFQGRKREEAQRTAEREAQEARKTAERKSREATGLSLDQLTEAARLWDAAFQAAGEQARENEKTAASQKAGGEARYSLNADFGKRFDVWLDSGKKNLPGSGRFLVGTTSQALRSIGVADYQIYWNAGKLAKIMSKHPAMTADVIKSVPEVLEHPILVMQSQTVTNRITLFGEATDADGKPVLVALELSPQSKSGEVQDFAVIASVYGKKGAQHLIDSSDILYVDPDKKRTDNWLGLLRLQLPSRLTSYGSIASITTVKRDVNGNISFGETGGKTDMQAAFEKAMVENKKTRFSLKEPIEGTRDLLALHNLTEQNLRDALELGGLPMPSIAVVQAKQGHAKYGPISLVFGKDTIDPKASEKNKVYGGDAYTATAPTIDRVINSDVERKVIRTISELAEKTAGGLFAGEASSAFYFDNSYTNKTLEDILDDLTRNNGVKAAYLADLGKTLEPVMQEKVDQYDSFGNDALSSLAESVGEQELAAMAVGIETEAGLTEAEVKTVRTAIRGALEQRPGGFSSTPEQRARRIELRLEKLTTERMEAFVRNAQRLHEDGIPSTEQKIDRYATMDALRDAAPEEAVREWVRPQVEGLLGEAGIYNGKERFTPSGNRKGFSALHHPYTLENIVKAMASQQSERGEAAWGVTAKTIQSVTTPSYKSIGDIKADSGRLGTVEEAAYKAQTEAIDDKIMDIIQQVKNGNEAHSDNPFIESDIIGDAMLSAARGAKTVDGIIRSFAKDDYKISAKTAQDIQAVFKAAAALPTEYFEAKPRRAVGFDEVLAAVVPADMDAGLRTDAERAGMRVLKYRSGDDAARLEAVNSVEGAKFSLKGADALEREVARLSEQNRALREQFRVTKGKGARMDKKAVSGLAKSILTEYSSAYDKSALEEKLHHLFGFLANGRDAEENELTYAAAKREALGTARAVLERTNVLDDRAYREYRELRAYLRGTRMTLDFAYRADLDVMGGYEALRKANFGRMALGNSGIGVDVAYQELSGRWPEFFPDTITHPADQLMQISDVLDGLRPAYENPYSANLNEAAEFLATDLLERFYDVPQAKPTYADRQAEKLGEVKWQYREQARTRVRQIMDQEAAKRQETTKKLKDHYAEMRARERGRINESAERDTLLKVARRLDHIKTIPQNRAVIEGLIGDLDLVAKGITGRTVHDLQSLENWYRDLQNPDSDIYDPDFIRDRATEAAIDRLKKKQIADMDMGDVRELTRTLMSIEHELRTERKLLGEEEKRDIYHLAEQSMEDIKASKGSKADSPLDAYNTLSLSAMREFRRLTGYREDSPIYKLAMSLNDGQRKMMDFQMRASKLFDELVRDKAEMERFTGKKAKEIPLPYLKGVGGEPVAITPAMRVSLYLHSKSPQNLLHIKVGGIVAPDMALYREGKMQEAYARGTVVKLKPSEVRQIVAGMTAKERAFADKAYQFFNKLSKNAINETSITLNGYEKAIVDNYFPLRSSRNFNRAQFESLIHDGTIEGMGILKEREARSTNPVVLEDVTAVLLRQIDNVGRYYGLAVPIRNFNKVWNVTTKGYKDSVKQSMESKWGSKATGYIENLMTDLQDGRQSYGSKLDKLRGNFAQAVLSLNVSVTMKQAASYPTAAGVIGWRPLVRAFGDFGRVDRELVAKYTPLLWYREQGGSSTELGDIAHRKGWADKMPALMGWIQKSDVLTVAKLWKASEYFIQETRKNLPRGTDAYYKALAEVFNRVVEESQPNYTVMQRPDVLRTPNQGLRAITMFSTQRMQNYNMLYDAVGNWKAKEEAYKYNPTESNLGKLKEARKNLARNVSAQLVAAATISVMTLAASALLGRTRRYEDDDEDEITLESLLAALGDDFVGTLMGSSLFGADVYNAVKAVFGGETWYDIDNPSVTMINDVVSALKSFFEAVEEIRGGEADAKKIALKGNALTAAVSKFLGVPLENVEKLTGGLAQRIFKGVCGPLLGQYYYVKYTTDTGASKGKGELYDLLWKAKNQDADAYEQMYEDMVESGFEPDSIKAALDGRRRSSKDFLAQAETVRQEVTAGLEGNRRYQSLAPEYQNSAVEFAGEYARYFTMQEQDPDYELPSTYQWVGKAQEGESVGLEPYEYILFKTALEMAYEDGSITQEEVIAAINSLPGLTKREKDYLFGTRYQSDKNNPWA